MPFPSSATVITSSSPASAVTVMDAASVCRTALVTLSLTTASAWSATLPVTNVSTVPANRTDNAGPSSPMTSVAASNRRRLRLVVVSGSLCRSKIAVRISLMVRSN